MKNYIYHTDPGHGWLAVKRKELEQLGLLDKVSHYSYQRGATVYLEEDCDMSLFHDAKGFADNSHYVTKYCDKQHPIRSYAPFQRHHVVPVAGLRIIYDKDCYKLIEPVNAGAWRVVSNGGVTYRMRASQLERAEVVK